MLIKQLVAVFNEDASWREAILQESIGEMEHNNSIVFIQTVIPA